MHLLRKSISRARGLFIHIAHKQDRLAGQKLQHFPSFQILFLNLNAARWFSFFKHHQSGFEQALLLHCLLITAAHFAAKALQALLNAFNIGQHQLGFDRLGVRYRVDAPINMGNIRILKTAQHMSDGIDLADICQKLVAKPFAF